MNLQIRWQIRFFSILNLQLNLWELHSLSWTCFSGARLPCNMYTPVYLCIPLWTNPKSPDFTLFPWLADISFYHFTMNANLYDIHNLELCYWIMTLG